MPDDSQDGPKDNLIPLQPENFAEEIIATNNSNPIKPGQETIIMETHAEELHKAPGHGIKHYLFEFLMLFLAVFCGFLAENYRETLVNKEKEHHYLLVGRNS